MTKGLVNFEIAKPMVYFLLLTELPPPQAASDTTRKSKVPRVMKRLYIFSSSKYNANAGAHPRAPRIETPSWNAWKNISSPKRLTNRTASLPGQGQRPIASPHSLSSQSARLQVALRLLPCHIP